MVERRGDAVREPIYRTDGDMLVPTDRARGPWFPDVQHGGAVAGLVARAVEAVPAPVPMHLARLTLDLSRKVPLAPTAVIARVVRDGRRVQAVEVAVVVDGLEVSRATALRVRRAAGVVDPDLVLPPWPGDEAPGRPEDGVETRFETGPFEFVRCFEARRAGEPVPGRGTTWYRLDHPLVDGETPSPAIRVAMTADLIMSAGSAVGFDRYLSANPDLTVSAFREPVDDWVAVASTVRFGADGVGQSDAVLADRQGCFGRVLKSLLIDRR